MYVHLLVYTHVCIYLYLYMQNQNLKSLLRMLKTYTSYPIVLALLLPSFRLSNIPTHISAGWAVLDMI